MGKLASWIALAAWGAGVVSGEGLHDLAVQSGRMLFFGTATDVGQFNDLEYTAILNATGEFGIVVPENSMKWQATEPKQNQFTLENADAVMARAKGNGQKLRCHTLTWHSQLPEFVSAGKWTRETLTAVIETHISHVVGHFKGDCYSWDVVNEALADNGTLRDSVFSRTLGRDFIPISFRAAAAADPGAKLYYNDFSLEFNSAKTDGAVGIVRDLQAEGVRIDGLGFQGHLEVGKTPSQKLLSTVLGRFTDLGLEVALTELDIRCAEVPASEEALQQQAKDYAGVVQTCVDHDKCVGVVVWQFTDKYSWIPDTFPGTGDACLWDNAMQPKPAYAAVSKVLQKAVAKAAAAGGSGNGTSKAASPPPPPPPVGAEAGTGADNGVSAAAVSQPPSASGAVRIGPLSSSGGIAAALLASWALAACWQVL
ncbi:glycosyl hydrolase family 10 [Colletotrichum graminicola]|uniref:Beta-xylanase n=1 Tax=Colletotrichum graminicola (strain M1.001 / M2 / FGSC 10212) TaxID=645133 RepID=E3Q8L2_COLGM|nr:glycosyl hydrolase family 10 [Colletotrichum graminicola M1.001]EFQ26883.1 glycosyl hydrolase family 10 [Colletotrichum graminicola M1.001]WDK16594.1 glycosyl hydrolase family 10 [Colletotrichum graminicola]